MERGIQRIGGGSKPPRDFYTLLEAFVFREVI
jgi:hypothetical protein